MSVYGGVYMDLDFECVKPMDDLIFDNHLVLGKLGPNIQRGHSLPNAWMASKPGHPFWQFMLGLILEKENKERKETRAEHLAGPVALREAYLRYMKLPETDREPITIADTGK
jgi:mannosyltransferase OCH1-like enzyme